ncbi:hypothetical protein [Aliikangiella sp. G2MR2-5]|uniref:hypothetical protein n=1 Tax=Aliikangiella sp. G2MR2-5 TaxID=2788943 RepID=UPI0018AA27BF|nr:hypothetical protein [Aliikangiella sp. G2MR2-5]
MTIESETSINHSDNARTASKVLNPYQSPSAKGLSHQPDEAAPEPDYKLYPPLSIAIATLLGSSLAGGFLLYANFDSVGEKGKALAVVIATILLSVIIIFFSLVLFPNSYLSYIVVNFIVAIMLLPIAFFSQRHWLDELDDDEERLHTLGRAVIIGFIGFFGQSVIISLAVTLFFGLPHLL